MKAFNFYEDTESYKCDYPTDDLGASSYFKRILAGFPGVPNRCNNKAIGYIGAGFRLCRKHYEEMKEKVDTPQG